VSFAGSYTDPGYPVPPTIAWSFGDGGTAEDTLTPTHTYADNGIYTVELTVTYPRGSATSFDTLTVTVANVAPTVTADPTEQEVQYSDPVTDVTFTGTVTFTAIDVLADVLNAAVSWKLEGGATFTDGLPDAYSIEPNPGSLVFVEDPNQANTWTLNGIADLEPNTYIIRVTVTDDDGGEGYADATIVVQPEDARSTYVGPMFVSTPSIDETTAVVELRAVIQDITLYPEDENWDEQAGNITMSTVSFFRIDNGVKTAIKEGLEVALVDPSDPTTGAAVFEWPVNLNSADSESYTVECVVGGAYSSLSSPEEVVITVSKPLQDFITGGGYLINENSVGTYAGDDGLKTNFGFSVKFNKTLTNLQGKVNAIVRQDGHVYQIKTNATDSLVVDPTTNTATFVSKANLTDITDPANPISISGSLSLIVTLTDNGEAGTADSIGFTLWKNNKLWFSSNWTGSQTEEQVLAGGNLVVHTEPLPLFAATGLADEKADDQLVTAELLEPIVEEAVSRWANYGIGSKGIRTLQDVEFQIADLDGSTTGLTLGSTVWLDTDAAGYGWFVDETPWDDAEFGTVGRNGELLADNFSVASGRMDLLTVVMHELGHILGLADLISARNMGDVMYETLPTGVRRTSTSLLVARETAYTGVGRYNPHTAQINRFLFDEWFHDWLRQDESMIWHVS
jgi:PKD repeat protein